MSRARGKRSRGRRGGPLSPPGPSSSPRALETSETSQRFESQGEVNVRECHVKLEITEAICPSPRISRIKRLKIKPPQAPHTAASRRNSRLSNYKQNEKSYRCDECGTRKEHGCSHISKGAVERTPNKKGDFPSLCSPSSEVLRKVETSEGFEIKLRELRAKLEIMETLFPPSQPICGSGRLKAKVPNLESPPTTVKDLLATGLLAGLRVKYVRFEQVRVTGRIDSSDQAPGVLCDCNHCQGNKKVTLATFEKHAGSLAKNPRHFIYIDNGKTLAEVMEASRRAAADGMTVEDAILSAIRLSPPASANVGIGNAELPSSSANTTGSSEDGDRGEALRSDHASGSSEDGDSHEALERDHAAESSGEEEEDGVSDEALERDNAAGPSDSECRDSDEALERAHAAEGSSQEDWDRDEALERDHAAVLSEDGDSDEAWEFKRGDPKDHVSCSSEEVDGDRNRGEALEQDHEARPNEEEDGVRGEALQKDHEVDETELYDPHDPCNIQGEIIRNLPTHLAELLGYEIDWDTFDEVELDESVWPWITWEIDLVLGHPTDEGDRINLQSIKENILRKFTEHRTADELLKCLGYYLPQQAPSIFRRLWRRLIFLIQGYKTWYRPLSPPSEEPASSDTAPPLDKASPSEEHAFADTASTA